MDFKKFLTITLSAKNFTSMGSTTAWPLLEKRFIPLPENKVSIRNMLELHLGWIVALVMISISVLRLLGSSSNCFSTQANQH